MISVVILTHNDEAIIQRTLESVSFCDEIIVIDDFSTDATVKIAKTLGATVYSRHLDGDFASQRNFGLEKAKGEWVLFVDSDEVVSTGLSKEIKSISSSSCGYYIKRRDYFGGTWLRFGETANTTLLRLAKKGAGHWRRPVHEVWEVTGEVAELRHPLDHYPHPSVAQFLDEINRYSSLNAQFLYQNKTPVSWWDIVIYPLAKFIHNYFLRLGFLDGTPGMVMATMMSFHSFLTRAKLWQHWQKRA